MLRKVAGLFALFAVAFSILAVSVLRSSSFVGRIYSQSPSPEPQARLPEIDYDLAYPGRILPNSFLWPVKALRDKIWVAVVTNPSKKAEILLLNADKRLWAAYLIAQKEEFEVAVSTLSKAEKYLEEAFREEEVARQKGTDTTDLLQKIALASLKHRHMMEETMVMYPEDAKPQIVKTLDYSKNIYKETKSVLSQMGKSYPENPFEK